MDGIRYLHDRVQVTERYGLIMATWVAHLRVADGVLKQCKDLSSLEYVMGNIAPDSGVPSKDWSSFEPPKSISHYLHPDEDGKVAMRPEVFAKNYLAEEKRKQYSKEEYSFYLGYYHHLLADVLWHSTILEEAKAKDSAAYRANPDATVWKWKEDWYDLDFLYLELNPQFEAWNIYKNAVGFSNQYLGFFAENAFADRQKYITGFYSQKKKGIHREYPYLNEQRMSAFVAQAEEQNLGNM